MTRLGVDAKAPREGATSGRSPGTSTAGSALLCTPFSPHLRARRGVLAPQGTLAGVPSRALTPSSVRWAKTCFRPACLVAANAARVTSRVLVAGNYNTTSVDLRSKTRGLGPAGVTRLGLGLGEMLCGTAQGQGGARSGHWPSEVLISRPLLRGQLPPTQLLLDTKEATGQTAGTHMPGLCHRQETRPWHPR